MLAPIFDRIMYFNLGALGRYIVAILQKNVIFFLVGFIIYAGIIFYAKVIWTCYLPKKMKAFLESNRQNNLSKEALYQLWTMERKAWPKYLLVPSHNEFWVKPVATMTGEEQKLFYNSEKKKRTEKECFMSIADQKI